MSKELEALELIDDYITLDDYDKETKGIAEAIRLVKKALKRNEPSKVIIHEDIGSFECSNCTKNGVTDRLWMFSIFGEYKHCPECGSKLDWE